MNNTAVGCRECFRVHDNPPLEALVRSQVELAGNLLFDGRNADAAVTAEAAGGYVPLRNRPDLVKEWRFRANCRDLGGSISAMILPLGPGDRRLDLADLTSRDTSRLEGLRPRKGSALATQATDPWLPAFEGALPPEGSPAWDWEVTWKGHTTTANGTR